MPEKQDSFANSIDLLKRFLETCQCNGDQYGRALICETCKETKEFLNTLENK